MNTIIKSSLLAFTVFASGCASLGNDNYGCKGMPNGSSCLSTVEIYEETNKRNDLEVNYSKDNTAKKKSRSKFLFFSDDEEEMVVEEKPDEELLQKIRNQQRYIDSLVPDARGTVPVLKSAEVLRFLVMDHESTGGQWSGESFHFIEVTPRKWSTGEVHETNPEVLHPIQVVRQKPVSKP